MNESTTIQIDRALLELLKGMKQHPRQSYSEVIAKLANAKEGTQYDRYLHEIQKNKMRELWDNKDDEAWDDV